MKIKNSFTYFIERMRNNRFTRVIVEILFWAIIMVVSTIAQGHSTLAEDGKNVLFEPIAFTLFGIALISYAVIYLVDALFKKTHRVDLFVGLACAAVDFVFGILVIVLKDWGIIISLTCTMLFFNIIARLVVRVFLERKHRIFRAVLSIFLFFLWLIFSFVSYDPEFGHFTFFSLSLYFIMMASILEIVVLVFSNLDLPILKKVFFKTFAFEVFVGLAILILSFSFYFWYFETSMTSYFDGIWYCFAIVTTIGFGDVTATTTIGRILTVILGFYGMIVVALLTSIIVNFYMETKSPAANAESDESSKIQDGGKKEIESREKEEEVSEEAVESYEDEPAKPNE